ncbi:MAG: hypothetical protein JJE41_05525 [Candidatus Heimdallarchaeota archaeon]|nr:hypothetical protein [Candidatus Heimdallarchaeota archaeon]
MARDFSRIVVYGSTSVGKTTTTKELGSILKSEVIILDDVFWGPNWEMPTTESFQKKVKELLSNKEKWIVDGNYSKVRPLILPNATFAVILNLPLYLILWRVFARTVSRNTPIMIHEPTPLPKRVEESGKGEHIIQSTYELSYYAIRNKIRKKIPGIVEEVRNELGDANYILLSKQSDVDKFLNIIRKIEGQGTT